MKILYYRVGMDTGVGGCVGPIFDDGTFEYIPIPDYFTSEKRSYANVVGRSGKSYSSFVPKSISNCSIHWDPEFNASVPVCCEGTTQQKAFSKLKSNDYLVHYAGLSKTPLASSGNIDLYFIGFIKVKEVIKNNINNIENEPINAHTRRYRVIKNLIQNFLLNNKLNLTIETIIEKIKEIDSLTTLERNTFYKEKCEKILVSNNIILNGLIKSSKEGIWKIRKKPLCLTSRIKEITPPIHVLVELLHSDSSITTGRLNFPLKSYIDIFSYILWCFTQFMLVIGKPESQLLSKAFKISKRSIDKRGQFLNRVKDDIAPLLGIPKNTSLQRKNLRFIPNIKNQAGEPEKLIKLLSNF
ncbi:MAG: hypothetical protein HZR80_10090 [Candidatus Heimdallarchaeota archaeon]